MASNVFTAEYQETLYHDALARVRVVHQSPDARHMTFCGELPVGVRFVERPSPVEESFYIVRGTITCRLEDGQTLEWKEGDLVYWPYEQTMELEYSPGLLCVRFVWSDEPLPDFTGNVQQAI